MQGKVTMSVSTFGFGGSRSRAAGRRRLPAVRAGFDDLTVAAGLVAVALAVVPGLAVLGLVIGLLGLVCALAALERGRRRGDRAELDHPARLWCGMACALAATGIGVYRALAAAQAVLHTLHP